MIHFDNKFFLFHKPIRVIDTCKATAKHHPPEIDFKTDNPNIITYYVQFSKVIPDNIQENKNALFTSYKIDESYVKKWTLKDLELPDGKKVKGMYFENFCLPNSLSMQDIIYIFSYLFDYNRNYIIPVQDYDDGNQWLFSNKPRSFARDEKDYIFAHQRYWRNSKFQNQEGETAKIHAWGIFGQNNFGVKFISAKKTELMNSEELFYKNYYQTCVYIKEILNNATKLNLRSLSLPISITTIKILLAYHSPPSAFAGIDIYKLFNIHHINSYSKIYVHSDNIDNFNNNTRPLQYVKHNAEATNVFKGIDSIFNCCALYSGTDLGNGLALHHIEIFPDMNVNLVFTNINKQDGKQFKHN